MTSQTLSIILANAALLIAAVWRLSAMLSKIETQLAQVIKDQKEDRDATANRLNSLEARILNFERAPRKGA